jgi:hypothetical protein
MRRPDTTAARQLAVRHVQAPKVRVTGRGRWAQAAKAEVVKEKDRGVYNAGNGIAAKVSVIV